jgi:hypothetical protein
MDSSYRIFNCAKCSKLVSLCRPCDRGNIYCSAPCASTRRRDSLREAGARYQHTEYGKEKHAARQARYRQRLALSRRQVTQHTSNDTQSCAKAVETNPDATDKQFSNTARLICTGCSHCIGPFARFDFWRSGRRHERLLQRYSIRARIG